MELFPRYWPFVRGIHQWRGPLLFSLICAWINKRLSKQWWGWWFETPSRPLWRYCNGRISWALWRRLSLAQPVPRMVPVFHGITTKPVFTVMLRYLASLCVRNRYFKAYQTHNMPGLRSASNKELKISRLLIHGLVIDISFPIQKLISITNPWISNHDRSASLAFVRGMVSSPHKGPVSRKMFPFDGNIFRVTGLLCGELAGGRWIPRTKASDAELWCFLWSMPD